MCMCCLNSLAAFLLHNTFNYLIRLFNILISRKKIERLEKFICVFDLFLVEMCHIVYKHPLNYSQLIQVRTEVYG